MFYECDQAVWKVAAWNWALLRPMMVPGLTATVPLNLIESRFLCNVHQNMSFFFFFLTLHLIKGQWSAAAQTSPYIKPSWIITCFIGSFTTSGFWSPCLRDAMPLLWPDASKTEMRSFNCAATNPCSCQGSACHSFSVSDVLQPGNVFVHTWSGFVQVDTIHLLDDRNDPCLRWGRGRCGLNVI